jgi:hypothetical protein
MSTKLKDLKVTKVAFVEAGANPKADILLFKSKDGKPGKTKETGNTEDPKEDPEKANGKVKADSKDIDGKDKGETKKSLAKRLFNSIAKAHKIEDSKVEEVTKGTAETFGQKMDERQKRRVSDQIWDMTYALNDSLMSIICDDETAVDQKPALMQQSIAEFTEAVKELVGIWAEGKVAENVTKSDRSITPEQLEIAKAAKARLEEIIKNVPTIESEVKEGENEEMKINKSLLTPEELSTLEAIEKKAGIQEPDSEPTAQAGVAKSTEEGVEKSKHAEQTVQTDEDIYKGLHPAVKAEIERLRKAADAAETKELNEVAKKYTIIGKKPEELAPVLKSLKTTSQDAYNQMISVLDASVEAVNKSGIFNEIGKAGSGEASAWTMIEKSADEIQKAAPDLTRAQAIDKACAQNPQLVHDYECNR